MKTLVRLICLPLLCFAAHGAERSDLTIRSEPPSLAAQVFPAKSKWTQLGGGYKACEGPQWIVVDRQPTLLFAAHHDFLALRWTERDGLKTWRADSPEATSFRPDGKGGYYVVEQTHRRLTRWDAEGRMTAVLAAIFEGKRLNRPNDVVVKSDGTLWFTDPDYLFKQRPDEKKELDGQFVYRLDPSSGQLAAVARELKLPNGIAFSPGERYLYLTDSAGDAILRAAVRADGSLGPREVFARVAAKGLDGLAFDAAGRLWCASMDGVHIFDPASGVEVGVLTLPLRPTAMAFLPGPKPMVAVTARGAAFIAPLQP